MGILSAVGANTVHHLNRHTALMSRNVEGICDAPGAFQVSVGSVNCSWISSIPFRPFTSKPSDVLQGPQKIQAKCMF